MSKVLLERNDLEAVEAHLTQAIDLGKWRGRLNTVRTAAYALSRLRQARHDLNGALDETPPSSLRGEVLAIQARILIRQGSLTAAARCIEEAVRLAGRDRRQIGAAVDLAATRVLVAQRRPGEAAAAATAEAVEQLTQSLAAAEDRCHAKRAVQGVVTGPVGQLSALTTSLNSRSLPQSRQPAGNFCRPSPYTRRTFRPILVSGNQAKQFSDKILTSVRFLLGWLRVIFSPPIWLQKNGRNAMLAPPIPIRWLTDECNPGVRLRALTVLCALPADDPEVARARRRVLATLPQAKDLSWMGLKGQALTYNLTALAETGLTRSDVAIGPVVDRLLDEPFDLNCGQGMLLRALVMLGYLQDERLAARLERLGECQLPDGGWLCLHRLDKMQRIPKSCIKANVHALLLAGELRKRGLTVPWAEGLLDYFRRRRLFYRMDDSQQLVLNCQPGYRMIDVHVPIEYLRVGLTYLMEALYALGQRETPEFQEAWQLLASKQDPQGCVRLEGQLAKSYLPKERVGQPSRWATLYTALCSAR